MPMRWHIAAGLVFLLSLWGGSAEGQYTPPDIIDPATVFTDAVEIVEQPLIVDYDLGDTDLSGGSRDDQKLTLHFYDHETQSWLSQAIETPDNRWKHLTTLSQLKDGTYFFVFRANHGDGSVDKILPDDWVYDPEIKAFRRPELICGEWAKDSPGYGIWIGYQNPETEAYHFCHTETGELTKPLPEGVSIPHYRDLLFLSPNQEWVVFLDPQVEEDNYHSKQIYAYEIATGELHALGRLDYFGDLCAYLDIPFWVKDANPVLESVSHCGGVPNVHFNYVEDITQPVSMQNLVSISDYTLTYVDKPPHYEWTLLQNTYLDIGVESDQDTLQRACELNRFNVQTGEWQTDFIPHVCGIGKIIPSGNGDRLYRDSWLYWEYWNDREVANNPARLLRINFDTGKKEVLFTGEIERIESISPDGRYAILLMDNDGHVGPSPYNDFPLSANNSLDPYFGIFDLTTLEIVYEIPIELYSEFYYPHHKWLSGDKLLIFDRNEVHLIQINGDTGTISDTNIGELYLVGTGTQSLILKDFDEETLTIKIELFDWTTDQRTPIIETQGYHIQSLDIEWLDEDLMEVVLSGRDSIGKWIIRVP